MTSSKKNSVLQVAKYFINIANEEKRPITNKVLQKLVYYAQAWFLVFNNKKLFNESIEAWVHGPAVRSLYLQYKRFGFDPIQEEIDPSTIKFSKKTTELLDTIWKLYGKMDVDYLEMLTHSEKPWKEAREGLQSFEISQNEISLKTMKDFYSDKLKEAKSIQKKNR